LSKKFRNVGLLVLVIIFTGLFAGLTWGNKAIINQNPVEKKFLVPWLGMRTFLELEKDPYGESAAQRAQVLFYGRLANSNEDPLLLDQPFASEILYLPLALIGDYSSARLVWMILLELALIGSAFLCLYLFEWKLPLWLTAIFSLSAVLGVQSIIPLLENDHAVLIVFCLIIGLIFLQNGRDELAGGFLAFTFFLPSATGFFCLVLIWWVIRNGRWRVIWGMLMMLGFLFIISFALLPGWLLPFFRSFKAELPFNGYVSTYGIFASLLPAIGNKVAIALTFGVLVIFILELRSKQTNDFRWFIWAAMLSLGLNSLSGIPGSVVNNIFIIVPTTLILKILSEKMNLQRRWLYTSLLLGTIFITWWGISIELQNLNRQFSSNLVDFIFPSLLTVIGLYWIRWWAIHPNHTWMDTIKSEQL
jgi:hypothetical protein